MSDSVTLGVEVDEEALQDLVDLDLTTYANGEISGTASVDIEEIMAQAVGDVELIESSVPSPIAIAIVNSIRKS